MTIAREWLDLLKILHGTYNTLIALALLYQGSLGLKIRKARREGGEELRAVGRHRRSGPLLVLLGILGYVAGVILIYLDKGHLFEFRIHHGVGLMIVILLFATFRVSRRIGAPDSPWRTPHFLLGVTILCAYLLQLYLGLNILL
ncbi:MAG: DUF4079 family protein [Deltaproteobacteria bacterium]|nr:DUF4079 family protein [Deltaproteobacteria bacterium]